MGGEEALTQVAVREMQLEPPESGIQRASGRRRKVGRFIHARALDPSRFSMKRYWTECSPERPAPKPSLR
jgi:hypothetical protein